MIYAIESIHVPELKRQLEAKGFELAQGVGARIIITGRSINGVMHTVCPYQEITALDGNMPIFQAVCESWGEQS